LIKAKEVGFGGQIGFRQNEKSNLAQQFFGISKEKKNII